MNFGDFIQAIADKLMSSDAKSMRVPICCSALAVTSNSIRMTGSPGVLDTPTPCSSFTIQLALAVVLVKAFLNLSAISGVSSDINFPCSSVSFFFLQVDFPPSDSFVLSKERNGGPKSSLFYSPCSCVFTVLIFSMTD